MKRQYLILTGGLVAVFFVLVVARYYYTKQPAQPAQHADRDRDWVVRTLWAEARHEPRDGQKLVLWVMRNRVGCYGWSTLSKVVSYRRGKTCQFEPWCSKKTRSQMRGFSKNYHLYQKLEQQKQDNQKLTRVSFSRFKIIRRDYKAYRKLAALYDHVMNADDKFDPTDGAFYFENRAITKKRGRKSLCHGRKVTVIGNHSFCKAEKTVLRKKCNGKKYKEE